MFWKTLIVGAFGAIASATALGAFEPVPAPSGGPSAAIAAGYPCEPVLTPPTTAGKPSAPTNLRITGGGEEPLIEPEALEGSGPFVPDGDVEPMAVAVHPYFDALSTRGDCQAAYHLRTQDQLDAVQTGAKESAKKKPVTYDAQMDAALFRMYAPETTDSQQKIFPVRASSGTLLLVWDFRFGKGFKWEGEGYTATHKTWRLDSSTGTPWLALKTDYQRAANQGAGIAEFYMSVPSNKFIAPGTVRGSREIPEPKLGEFFIQVDTWTRAWWLFEDLGTSIAAVSLWVADPGHAPVRIYNRLAIYTPADGLDTGSFRMEYDTSMDTALNPVEMHSWNRNFVVLTGISASSVPNLLERP